MRPDKGGRPPTATTVRRTVARAVNRYTHQLSEAVMAKALTGDSTAQLAAVQLLQLGMGETKTPTNRRDSRAIAGDVAPEQGEIRPMT